MNKKFILTSILVITFALPAMAEITSGATCDTTNLGQSENNSTANVEATWTPNTYTVTYNCGESANVLQAVVCDMMPESNGCGTPIATFGTEYTFRESRYCPHTGYTFTNWSCVDSSNNTTTYLSGQTINEWNIASNVTCTAQYSANTINIDWYSDNQKLTVSNDAASCTYGGTITLPETPSKIGYTFGGWQLRNDCPNLDTPETCNANSTCIWDCQNSTCEQRATDCSVLDNATDCEQYFNCHWNEEESVCYQQQNQQTCGVQQLLQ